jgi:hypothetical protein
MSENRKRYRLPVKVDVVIRSEDKAHTLFGRTRDISMQGLYVKSVGTMPPGGRCSIEIVAQERGAEMIIKTKGVVARQENGGYGVAFDSDLAFWPMLALLKPGKK